ncbi:MAG TPA: flagellar basal body P-ring formation chaperone FlgA [Steroidobacteraceae bacterium]|nr:flagellar basal body P-ring formation chaperone FlgA [Steroidobacteraceae bacterium]
MSSSRVIRIRPHSALLALALFALAAAPLHTAAALTTTSTHAIGAAAEQAIVSQAGGLAAQLSLSVAPLDPRLRLPACDQPLQASITGDGQVRHQTTVGVRCAGSVRWTIYTSVTVDSTLPVLIARYALPRDAALTAADFDLQTRRVPGLAAQYPANTAALAGQRLRTPLSAGQPLTRDALAPAPLIHRGQQVVILAHASGIDVRMMGVALSDGRIEDHIRVQNISSQRIVEAIVRSDSVVEAPL